MLIYQGIPATNYTNPFSVSSAGLPLSDIAGILIVIALFMTFRVYRGMKGTKYSVMTVYRSPVAYLAITIISLFFLSPTYTDIAVVFAVIIIGYLIGLKLAGGLQFFEKGGVTYYKRSPFIMIVWLVSFIIRFGVSFFLPSNTLIVLLVEVLLAGTTGMILGEATHINRSYKSYKPQT